ncbi:hypothetical protein A2U01_0119300, partial [Trifolium medium]|nr:hypothetical protein [Trifolium medium]
MAALRRVTPTTGHFLMTGGDSAAELLQ